MRPAAVGLAAPLIDNESDEVAPMRVASLYGVVQPWPENS
jgi:hypothetical protein